MKAKKEYPDLSANPQNIKIGDWVTDKEKFGKVTERVKSGICEFWVHWSGHTVPTNKLASLLFKVDYIGEDLANKHFDGGYCYQLLFQDDQIKAEIIKDDKSVEIWDLERLISSLESAANKPEIVPVSVVDDELTEEEESDRLNLERKVERAFYEAGKALSELRSRRLYRSTHSTFEEYCRDRFGFSYQNANYLIASAKVVDVLTSNACQILPTSVRQALPLASIEPDKQVEAWTKAVETAGGKIPSGRIVKDIVQRIKEKTIKPVPNPYHKGEVCKIIAKDDPELRGKGGCWCIVSEVHEFSCTVKTYQGEMTVRLDNLKLVDYSTADCEAMGKLCLRLSSLYSEDLEFVKKWNLAYFGKLERPYLTEVEEKVLEAIALS